MQPTHRFPAPALGLAAALGTLLAVPAPAQHVIHVTPPNIQWGHFAADTKPILKVKPGEQVTIDTICGESKTLLDLHAAEDAPIREMKQCEAAIKDRGPGPHFLTGPVYIEGAMPGDVLEIQIVDIRLRSPYGWMDIYKGGGPLGDQFPTPRHKLVPLDARTMLAAFAPGIHVPIRPFFGCLGVAPPSGRLGSGPPAYNGGNMDNHWLVAGSRLYVPVNVPGALFEVGDGHAAQGDGEVCVTAIETNLTGVFKFAIRKDLKLKGPRAETPTHYIAIGLDKDLNEAARIATAEMVDILTTTRGLSRDDAYMLTSAAADLHVTQVVDGVKGVHAMLPKSIFGGAK